MDNKNLERAMQLHDDIYQLRKNVEKIDNFIKLWKASEPNEREVELINGSTRIERTVPAGQRFGLRKLWQPVINLITGGGKAKATVYMPIELQEISTNTIEIDVLILGGINIALKNKLIDLEEEFKNL